MSNDYSKQDCLVVNLDKLDVDISKVDAKLSDIDQLILDLKNNVNRAQAMLNNAAPSDKVSLYKVINSTMEMLNNYYQTYTRFMEIKFRYRSEHDNISYKQAHLIQIELVKMNNKTDASYYDMVEVLKSFAKISPSDSGQNSTVPGLPDDIQANLDALDDDSNYSTT